MSAIGQTVYQELCRLLPGGVNSPVRALTDAGRDPLVLERAKGDLLYDVDGKTYIDFCASWGALMMGHAPDEGVAFLREALERGTSYGVTSLAERDLALEVTACFPSMEKMRFCSSGTEATMYAVRLARGVTGRNLLVKFRGNYHGNADFFLTEAGSGLAGSGPATPGVPEDTVRNTLNLPYNDEGALEALFADPTYRRKIAAVIIEPIAGNMGVVPAKPSFLRALRKLTKESGSLLIFDEVITGFRVARGGAQALYGITPDLTCLGKIIGGGVPCAAFGGKKEYMDLLAPVGPIYQAGTLSGNPLAMASGLWVLRQIGQEGFYERLEARAKRFLEPVEKALRCRFGDQACLQRVGSMFTVFFGKNSVENMDDAERTDRGMFWRFFRHLTENGIYISPSPFETSFLMSAHTEEHLEKAQRVMIDFMETE